MPIRRTPCSCSTVRHCGCRVVGLDHGRAVVANAVGERRHHTRRRLRNARGHERCETGTGAASATAQPECARAPPHARSRDLPPLSKRLSQAQQADRGFAPMHVAALAGTVGSSHRARVAFAGDARAAALARTWCVSEGCGRTVSGSPPPPPAVRRPRPSPAREPAALGCRSWTGQTSAHAPHRVEANGSDAEVPRPPSSWGCRIAPIGPAYGVWYACPPVWR